MQKIRIFTTESQNFKNLVRQKPDNMNQLRNDIILIDETNVLDIPTMNVRDTQTEGNVPGSTIKDNTRTLTDARTDTDWIQSQTPDGLTVPERGTTTNNETTVFQTTTRILSSNRDETQNTTENFPH